jgi:hypothetical protein
MEYKNYVRADLEKMKIQNWSKMAMDREAWKRTVELAKTHKKLWHQEKNKLFIGLFNNMFQLNTLFSIKCDRIMTGEPVMIWEEASWLIYKGIIPNI